MTSSRSSDYYIPVLDNGKVFKRDGKIVWKCRNCGYLHEGKGAPKMCPACLHPQSYFEIMEMNY